MKAHLQEVLTVDDLLHFLHCEDSGAACVWPSTWSSQRVVPFGEAVCAQVLSGSAWSREFSA